MARQWLVKRIGTYAWPVFGGAPVSPAAMTRVETENALLVAGRLSWVRDWRSILYVVGELWEREGWVWRDEPKCEQVQTISKGLDYA